MAQKCKQKTNKSLCATLLLIPTLLVAQVARIEVAETAGLRRFGYPVRARIKTSYPSRSLHLVSDGKTIAAQFTGIDKDFVEIDFALDLGPGQKRNFVVEEGAAPPVNEAMSVEQTPTSYIVRHPGGLAFHVPKDLHGLLNAVQTTDTEYLQPDSSGLSVICRDNTEQHVVAVTSRVLKAGPLACALRFDIAEPLCGDRVVKSAVELEFPRSKSWVEAQWTVDDPASGIRGLMAAVNLRVDSQPLIVDFGAGTMIYATVRSGQSARMKASPSGWNIDVNGEDYAVGRVPRAEGWAHLMDRHRATAVAIKDFAETESSIESWADGRLRIRRDVGQTPKSFTFWLHFVGMPVQIGAATSPQSMMHPLAVHVK